MNDETTYALTMNEVDMINLQIIEALAGRGLAPTIGAPAMKTIIILTAFLAFLGCASPYQKQAQELRRAYENGEISANDYFTHLYELQVLDQQRRARIADAVSDAGKSLSHINEHLHRSPTIVYPLNNSRSGSGTVMTPNGRVYYYQYSGD